MSAELTVHPRHGQQPLEAVLKLVKFLARPYPLVSCLDELPRRLARIFGAQVCSIYLREGDALVMRGNVGFAFGARGSVRLAIGEGLTGWAVQCGRPISLGAAPRDARFRSFPELNEALYPVFLVVPIPGSYGPLGAVVLQRSQGLPFDEGEIALACALTAPIAAILERSKLTETFRSQGRRVARGTRRVTLSGRVLTAGQAFGRAYISRRPAEEQTAAPPGDDESAMQSAVEALLRVLDQLKPQTDVEEKASSLLDELRVMLEDARLRQRVREHRGQGLSLVAALSAVGAESVRAATRSGDPFAMQRAQLLDDLCETLAALGTERLTDSAPRSGVLLGDRFTLFDLVGLVRTQASAVVLSASEQPELSMKMLRLASRPTVYGVSRLLDWVSEGDLLLVDADHGLVRANPSRAEIAMQRELRRRG